MRSQKGSRAFRYYLPVISIALLIAVAGCEKKTTEPGPDIDELIDLGWEAFEAGDLDAANDYFYDAIAADPLLAEPRHGMGWVKLIDRNLLAAKESFEFAKYLELDHFGADVGLAIVLRDYAEYTNAISYANNVLGSIPTYVFPHISTLDWKDLRLIIAQCYYRKGEAYFDEAQLEVDILDSDNGLDPEDSGTWVVEGVTYDTYAEALLMAIEALEDGIADF